MWDSYHCGKCNRMNCECPEDKGGLISPTKEQLELWEKLRMEREKKEEEREEEFELRFKHLQELLVLMYSEARKEDLREFFEKVGNIKYPNLGILQEVINFLEEHKSSMEKLSLDQTCYLVLLFSKEFKYMEIKDTKVPGHVVSEYPIGHEQCKYRWMTREDFSKLFDFLVEVNRKTFEKKKISAPSNWRLSSMKYLDLLQRLLYFFERNRLKLFESKLIEASEAFSLLEKRENSDIWKAVIVSNYYYRNYYGTRYVFTTKFRNFTKWRGIWLPYKSVTKKSDA
jgi:hypothetical protein